MLGVCNWQYNRRKMMQLNLGLYFAPSIQAHFFPIYTSNTNLNYKNSNKRKK